MPISLRDLTCLLLLEASVYVHVQPEPLRSCLPDSPSYWEPNQPPFPPLHSQTNPACAGELRLGRSFLNLIQTFFWLSHLDRYLPGHWVLWGYQGGGGTAPWGNGDKWELC